MAEVRGPISFKEIIPVTTGIALPTQNMNIIRSIGPNLHAKEPSRAKSPNPGNWVRWIQPASYKDPKFAKNAKY